MEGQASEQEPQANEAEEPSLAVKNKIGDYIRSKNFKVSSELFGAKGLNASIKTLLDRAMARCEGNGRKTVMAQDL